jgi:hypothetical protein
MGRQAKAAARQRRPAKGATHAWQDRDALAANRAAAARQRANAAALSHVQVRGVEEYQVMFSSVRDGDTRSLIEREVELWNTRDREGWMTG